MIEILVTDNNEDELLRDADGADYALIYRNGHRLLDKDLFYFEIHKAKEFFIMGHVLDRESMDAYYELHHQCYVINLHMFRNLGKPLIGKQTLNSKHTQIKPNRSSDNYHDNYTPKWVSTGTSIKEYSHKAHGWNILSIGFMNRLPILVFNERLRKLKEYDYEINNCN
jgi:hypothetical protein